LLIFFQDSIATSLEDYSLYQGLWALGLLSGLLSSVFVHLMALKKTGV